MTVVLETDDVVETDEEEVDRVVVDVSVVVEMDVADRVVVEVVFLVAVVVVITPSIVELV